MKVAIFGTGNARDSATFARLQKEMDADEVLFLNLGVNAFLRGDKVIAVDSAQQAAVVARDASVDCVIVLDPNLLLAGAAELLRSVGCEVLAPNEAGLDIERRKSTCKQILDDSGIKTPRWKVVDSASEAAAFLNKEWHSQHPGFALKSDVFLADANLRTLVPTSLRQSLEMLALQAPQVRQVGGRFLLEEIISGTEISVHILCSGREYILFPPVKDYKRARDGDVGPNTHGAAAIAYGSWQADDLERQIRNDVIEPFLHRICDIGAGYEGFLYFGLMINNDEIQVLEVNVRPGNPEFVALLPLLKTPLAALIEGAKSGGSHLPTATWRADSFSGVAFAMARGYPESDSFDTVTVNGIDETEIGRSLIGEGIAGGPGAYVTNGGRVLAALATAPTILETRSKLVRILEPIRFDGMHFRRDLGFALDARLFPNQSAFVPRVLTDVEAD